MTSASFEARSPNCRNLGKKRNPLGLRFLIPLVTVFFIFHPSPLDAQNTPPADPADVESVDAIVAAVYDVISGPAGEARDWDRWRSLFLPEARLVSLSVTPDGESRYRVLTPEDYVQLAGANLEANGFFESEIGRTQEEFGPMVHLFSSYQSKRSLEDSEPFARGINSFQLMNDGERWWVLTIYWTGERPDLPIPEKYIR